MKVYWLAALPWDQTAGAGVSLRACSVDLSPVALYSGLDWIPVMDGGPDFETSVFGGAFTGEVTTTRGAVKLATNLGDVDGWASYLWQNRPVSIWEGDLSEVDGATVTGVTLIFDGLAESYDPNEASIILVPSSSSSLTVSAASGR